MDAIHRMRAQVGGPSSFECSNAWCARACESNDAWNTSVVHFEQDETHPNQLLDAHCSAYRARRVGLVRWTWRYFCSRTNRVTRRETYRHFIYSSARFVSEGRLLPLHSIHERHAFIIRPTGPCEKERAPTWINSLIHVLVIFPRLFKI